MGYLILYAKEVKKLKIEKDSISNMIFQPLISYLTQSNMAFPPSPIVL